LPKKRPEYFPGGVYHIYNRGHSRLSIFREPTNYLFVLRNIKKYLGELNLTLPAYCLMPNHYHFLVRQNGDQPAGRLSQRVFNGYSKAHNKRYQHSGTIFEGPYRVKPVFEENFILHLCRYMHANPVKDGLVAHPADWPYSNYLEWVGLREGTLVDREFVNQHFKSAAEYAEYVFEYLRTRNLPPDVLDYLNDLES
jgi:putative transposase